jgi:hypothetical protein
MSILPSAFLRTSARLTDRVSTTPSLERFTLLSIMLLGVAIRSASWWIQGFKGSDQSEFESMARSLVQGNWSAYLADSRAHQPVYALLLAPKYLLNLDLAAYTFVLQSLLACGTIFFVWRIARSLFGTVCGLMSALLIAVDLMIAFWFPWITGDAPFHFFLALFALTSVKVWEQHHLNNVLAFALCGVLCILSRPEGLFVAAVACATLTHGILSRYLPLWKIIVLILAGAGLCAGVIVATLYYDKPVRDAFFSNIHVANPLYISTRMSTNSPQEQTDAYNSMGTITEPARRRPGFVSGEYALSMEGLRFIKENPVRWFRMYLLRLASIVFPSVFSPWWSVRNRIYSFSTSFLLFFGSLIGCALATTRRLQAIGLTLIGLTIPIVVSLFQREVDYRVPLSMHVVLSCVAPVGWLGVMQLFATRRSNA